MYELFLGNKKISKEEWQKFIEIVSKFNGYFKKWSIIITNNNNEIRYYLKTKANLPPTLNELNNFVMKETSFSFKNNYLSLPVFMDLSSSLIDLIEYKDIKKKTILERIEINIDRKSVV